MKEKIPTKKTKWEGKRFGRLIVSTTGIIEKSESKIRVAKCICDCGKIKFILIQGLISKKTTSCGCRRIEVTIQTHKKHGMYKSDTYSTWKSMKNRIKNNKSRKIYKTITICERWEKFENFLKDMGERPGKEFSIDRINNNKGYYKENCRWASITEQNRNKNNNVLITYKKETHCINEWAEILKIKKTTLYKRLHSGWSIKKSFTKPVNILMRNRYAGKEPDDCCGRFQR